MQFNSYIFILAFLPILVIGYYLLNLLHRRAGNLWLLAGSALFYLYGGIDLFLIFAASCLVNYTLACLIARAHSRRRLLLTAGILCNVGLLFYFKYWNFFLSSLSALVHAEYTARDLLLPLGISFFTFQQLMYLLWVYRDAKSSLSLPDYLLYILYFPKLLMGPLAEPSDLIPQFHDPDRAAPDWDQIACAIKTFCFGLFKKLVLADTFALAVSWGFSNADAATGADLWLVMLAYTFEIYFDFSGYSDMAVGVSAMLHIDLPMNFDSPYRALSIRDFWKRWHMTLTGFLTRHVYFPLGGSRKGLGRTCLNTILVFLISGLWHGANWTFLLWGLLHGCLSVFDRLADRIESKVLRPIRWLITFLAVNFLWLLFRADSIRQWLQLVRRMLTLRSLSVSQGLLDAFVLPETPALFQVLHLEGINAALPSFSLLLFTAAAFFICLVPQNNYRSFRRNNLLTLLLSVAAFVWSVLCLSSESVFVYLNF